MDIFVGQAIVFRGLHAMSHGPEEGPWLTSGDEKESESFAASNVAGSSHWFGDGQQ
jgi:hypothetical protein